MAVTKPISPEEKDKMKSYIDKGKKAYVHKEEFTSVLLRIPISRLEMVDDKVKEKPWMNRTQWIMEAIEAKLNEDN